MAEDTGCLLIDDPLYPIGALEDMSRMLRGRGVRTEVFEWDGTGHLHLSLQNAYQRIRRDGAISGIVGLGAGCDCALALSCQLPVDRIVLVEPMEWSAAGERARQLKRIRAFARQNAAFCVCDALVIPGPHTAPALLRRLRRDLVSTRLTMFKPAEDLWSNRKEVLNLGIFHFLRDGVMPKSLAENPEMCIIYG